MKVRGKKRFLTKEIKEQGMKGNNYKNSDFVRETFKNYYKDIIMKYYKIGSSW